MKTKREIKLDDVLHLLDLYFKYYYMYLTLMAGLWLLPAYYGVMYLLKIGAHVDRYKYLTGAFMVLCFGFGFYNYYRSRIYGYKGNPTLRRWFGKIIRIYIKLLLLPLLVWYWIPKWFIIKVKQSRLFK
jgi:hypothetical protein